MVSILHPVRLDNAPIVKRCDDPASADLFNISLDPVVALGSILHRAHVAAMGTNGTIESVLPLVTGNSAMLRCSIRYLAFVACANLG